MSHLKSYLITKNKVVLSCLLFILVISGCKQRVKQTGFNKDTIKKSADTTNSLSVVKPAIVDTDADCPRGAAQPVAKKKAFTDAHFALQADKTTGIETFNLLNGDKIKIKQSGCEYYILNFQIETSHFAADTSDLHYWSDAVLSLMREINKGIITPLEIGNGLDKLSALLQADKLKAKSELKLNEEIDFGGPDPRQYLTIDGVTQLANKHYLLTITFSYGPI